MRQLHLVLPPRESLFRLLCSRIFTVPRGLAANHRALSAERDHRSEMTSPIIGDISRSGKTSSNAASFRGFSLADSVSKGLFVYYQHYRRLPHPGHCSPE
jgi:hypothetical protein